MKKKVVPIFVCLVMLASMLSVSAFAEEAISFWYNGDILTPYKNNHAFLSSDSPITYAFYYEGTDPEDSRDAGFYDMPVANNMDPWAHGYYFCGLTESETKDGKNDNRIVTIHQSCAAAPTYHYSPGYCFTAPYTGTVEFTYQFAKAYGGGGCDAHIFWVLRDVENPYEDGLIESFTTDAILYGEGANASGEPETQEFSIDVTEGEKIYFVIDNHDADGGMSAHWIKSAKYTSGDIPEATDTPTSDTQAPVETAPTEPNPDESGAPSAAPTDEEPADNAPASSNMTIWIVVAVVAVAAVVIVVVMKKKGKKES